MDSDRKKAYLLDIINHYSVKDEGDLLSALMPYDMVFARIDNVEMMVERGEGCLPTKLSTPMMDAKIIEEYLQDIMRKGGWSGDVMLSSIVVKDPANPYDPEGTACPMHVSAMDRISISIEDLFVYEGDFTALLKEHPDIFNEGNSVETSHPSPGSKKDVAHTKDAEQEYRAEPREQVPPHDATTTTPQPPSAELILPLPPIKNRVSTEGKGKEQVWNTCRDNPEAVLYVKTRRVQGAKSEEIAAELNKAGGGVGVIGCLLDPTKANVDSAREHGKYLLKKATQ